MQHTSGKVRIRVVPLGGVYTSSDLKPEARGAQVQATDEGRGADRHWTDLFRSRLRRHMTIDS